MSVKPDGHGGGTQPGSGAYRCIRPAATPRAIRPAATPSPAHRIRPVKVTASSRSPSISPLRDPFMPHLRS